MIRSTYHVTPELAGFSGRRLVMRELSATFLASAVYFLLGFVLGPKSVTSNLAESVFFGIVLGAWGYRYSKETMTFDVVVSDDSISVVRPWFARSIRRSEIRTITETSGSPLTPPALRISKYGRIGTFLFGCIWIPKGTSGYDTLKDLAHNWMIHPAD